MNIPPQPAKMRDFYDYLFSGHCSVLVRLFLSIVSIPGGYVLDCNMVGRGSGRLCLHQAIRVKALGFSALGTEPIM